MRIYFNLTDNVQRIPDFKGVTISDVPEARVEAEFAVIELLLENPSLKESVGLWHLEAVDSAGLVLFTIDFARIAN